MLVEVVRKDVAAAGTPSTIFRRAVEKPDNGWSLPSTAEI
jgi:hypothetical protein